MYSFLVWFDTLTTFPRIHKILEESPNFYRDICISFRWNINVSDEYCDQILYYLVLGLKVESLNNSVQSLTLLVTYTRDDSWVVFFLYHHHSVL